MPKDDVVKLVQEVLSQQTAKPDAGAKVKTAAVVASPLLILAMLFNTYFMPMVSADTKDQIEVHVTKIHDKLDARLIRMDAKLDRLIERK